MSKSIDGDLMAMNPNGRKHCKQTSLDDSMVSKSQPREFLWLGSN
jgi:hypothetical protein